jgi:hypothetical protein
VVTATSNIPLAGDVSLRRTTAGTAATTWVPVKATPGITIVPIEQTVDVGAAAHFTVTVTNTGGAALENGTVTSKIAPTCDRRFRKAIAPNGSRSYDCLRPNTTEDYTNVATISSPGLDTRTASARVLLRTPELVRQSIVDAALQAVRRQDQIEYSPDKNRMDGVRRRIRLPNVPKYEDTSSFVTWCYWQAHAPNPMGHPYELLSGTTDTLFSRGTPVLKPTPGEGDLVFYEARDGHRAVGIYIGHGRVVIHTKNGPSPMIRPLNFGNGFSLRGFHTYRSHPRTQVEPTSPVRRKLHAIPG